MGIKEMVSGNWDERVALGRYLWLRRMAFPSPPFRICDIGCGEGAAGLRFALGDFDADNDIDISNVIGVHSGLDCNEEFNKTSKQLFPACDFLTFDLFDLAKNAALPYETNVWDSVIISETIEHLNEALWPVLLQEAIRISKYQILLTMPDGGLPDRNYDLYPEGEAGTLYSGHQFEPCFATWQKIMQESFGERACSRKIPGFFVASVFLGGL